MDVKDIKEMENPSIKRKVDEGDEERKKMKLEEYCILCQTYGHIFSEECVTCLNCSVKGHGRRDCSELKSVKEENEYVEEEMAKDEPKKEAMQFESDNDITGIDRDVITALTMSKECIVVNVSMSKVDDTTKIKVYCKNEKEYVDVEIKKDETKTEMQFKSKTECKEVKKEANENEYVGVKIKKAETNSEEHLKSENEIKDVKYDMINLLTPGEDFKNEKSEVKHVKSEVKNEGTDYEKEYVEVEIKKEETKTKERLKSESEINKVEDDIIASLATREENSEREFSRNSAYNAENCELKICSVNLQKMDTKLYRYDNKAKYHSDLSKHMEVSHGSVGYACQKCSYKTDWKQALTRHIQAQHEGVTYSCEECSYKAKYKDHLAAHVKAKHDGAIYSCEECSYKAKLKSSLTAHIKAKHEGVTYSCEECSYEAKYKSALTAHIKAEHEGVTYSCEECSYETKYKSNLVVHIKAKHEGVYYPCEKCNYESKCKNNLRKHMKAKHDGAI